MQSYATRSSEKLADDESELEKQDNDRGNIVGNRKSESTSDSDDGTDCDVISGIQSNCKGGSPGKTSDDGSKPDSQVNGDTNSDESTDENDEDSKNKENDEGLADETDSDAEVIDEEHSENVKRSYEDVKKEDTLDNIVKEKTEYTFDEMVDVAGYGRFQRILTILAGLGWMADAFEIRVNSILGNFLACEWDMYRWHNALLTSIVFIGMMFGAPCFGVIADKCGRRKSLAIALLLVFIFGAISAISRNLETLITIRWIIGFVFGGATQGFTLCFEYYPAKTRGIAGFYLRYYWATGTMILTAMTWLIMNTTGNWRWLVVAASTPSLLVFFSLIWYPESVRWYQVSGQYEQAVNQMQTLLTLNKTKELNANQLKKISDDEVQGKFLDLLRSPHKKTTLLIWYISFAASFHYYGITLMSPFIIKQGHLMVPDAEERFPPIANVTSAKGFFLAKLTCDFLSTGNYIELLWNTSAEFPGLLVFTVIVRYINRKTLLSSSCLINAFMVLILLAEARNPIPTVIVLYISRAICCGILQLVLIMTTEAFPTTLRATGVGSGKTFSKLGAAIVPFVAQVLVIEDPISGVCIMGAIILLGAAAGASLPRETRDVPLVDLTEEQIEIDEEQEDELV